MSRTSPQAVDEQGEQITMEFSGQDAVPCGCVTIKQNGDDSFTLAIDQDKITQQDAGTFVIGVELTDSTAEKSRLKTSYTFEFQIEYEAQIGQRA